MFDILKKKKQLMESVEKEKAARDSAWAGLTVDKLPSAPETPTSRDLDIVGIGNDLYTTESIHYKMRNYKSSIVDTIKAAFPDGTSEVYVTEENKLGIDCAKFKSHLQSEGDSVIISEVEVDGKCKLDFKAHFVGFYDTLETLQSKPVSEFVADKSFAFVYQAGEVHHNNDMPLMVRFTAKGNAAGVTTASWKPAVPYAYNLLAKDDEGTRVYKPIQAIKASEGLSLDAEGVLSINAALNVKGKKTDGTAVTEKTNTIQFIDGLTVQKETDGSIKVKTKVTKQMESFLGFYDSEAAIFAKAIEKKSRLIPEVTTAYLRHAPYGVTTEEAGSYEIYRWKGTVSRPSTPTDDDIKNVNNWHTGNKLATSGYPIVLLGTGTPYSSWTPTNNTSYQPAHYTGQVIYHTNDKSWYWSEGTKWEKLFPASAGTGLFLGSFDAVDDLPSSPAEGSFAYVLNPVEAGVIQRGNPTLFMYQASRWAAKYPRGAIIAKASSGNWEHIEKIEVTGSIAQTIEDGKLHLDLSSLSQGDFKGFFNDPSDLPASAVSANESYAYVFTAAGEGSVSAGKLIPQLYVYQVQGGSVTPTWVPHHAKGAIICNTNKGDSSSADRPITSIKFTGDKSKRIENPNRELTLELPFTMDSHFVGIFDNMNAFTEAAKTYAGKFVKYQITGVIKQLGEYKLVRWNQDDEAPTLEDIANELHWDHIPLGSGGSGTLKVHGKDGSGANYTKEITDIQFSSDFEMTDYTPTGDGRTGAEATYKGFAVFEDDTSISDTVKVVKFANCTVVKDSRNVVTVTPLDGVAPPAPDNTILFTGKDSAGGDVTEVSKPEIKFSSEFVLTEDDSVADKPKMDISLKAGSVLIPFTGKDASGTAVTKSFGTFEFSDAFELTDDESDPTTPSKVQIGLKAGSGGSSITMDGKPIKTIKQTDYVHLGDSGELNIHGTFLGIFDTQNALFSKAKENKQVLQKDVTFGYVRKAPVGSTKGSHYYKLWRWVSTKTSSTIIDTDVENVTNWNRDFKILNADHAVTLTGTGSEYESWKPETATAGSPLLASEYTGQIVYWNVTDASKKGHYFSNGSVWAKLASSGAGNPIGIALDSVDKPGALQKIDVLGDKNLFSYEDGELSLNLKNALVRADDLVKLNATFPVNNNKSVVGYTQNNHKMYIASNKDSTTGAYSWQEFAYPEMNKDVDSCITRFPEQVELSDQFDDTEVYQKTGLWGITETKANALKVPVPQSGILESKVAEKPTGTTQELWLQTFSGLETGQEWKRFRNQNGSGHEWSAWKEVVQKLPLDDTNFTILTIKNGTKVKDIQGAPMPWRKVQDNTCNVKAMSNDALRVLRDGKYRITVVTHFSGRADWTDHPANVATELFFAGESAARHKKAGTITAGGAGSNPGEYPASKAVFEIDLASHETFDIRHIVTKGSDSYIAESDLDPFKNYIVIEPVNSVTNTGVEIAETLYESLGGLSFLPGQEVRMEPYGSGDRVVGERYRTDTVDLV